MATMKQIAELAGVSKTAVSYALNGTGALGDETRERILAIVREVGYQPNKIAVSLRTNRTRTIGVVAEDVTTFATPDIVDGICEYAEQAGYHIILDNLRIFHKIGNSFSAISSYRDEIAGLVDATLRNSVDGIVYVGIHCRDVAGIVNAEGKPVVYAYCFSSEQETNNFVVDDQEAAFHVTQHLIELGHRRIATITGLVDSIPAQERLKGFQKAILQYNISINPFYTQVGNWNQESGYEAAKKLLTAQERPTAIFAMNDYMACGVLQAAKELKLTVPKDLSVVGFDDEKFCQYCTPALSTVAAPLREMGRVSARYLIEVLEERKTNGKTKALSCQYIERGSVAAV